jgi:hypothetical protein
MIIRSACASDEEYRTALRIEFAKAALSGFSVDGHSDPTKWNWPAIAAAAWAAADAMIAAQPK